MTRISRCQIADFRGINGTVDLSFVSSADSSPVSLVIVGDNGSGKSSLVDGLEFNLRGRLSRRDDAGRKMKREVRNFASRRLPGVIVELSDGRTIRRGGGLRDSQVPQTVGVKMINGFQYSPLIIRRQHVEAFWSVPEDGRQGFFFDYLRQSFDPIMDSVQLAELESDLRDAERTVDEARAYIASLAGISPVKLPTTAKGLRNWKGPMTGVGRRSLSRDVRAALEPLAASTMRRNELLGNLKRQKTVQPFDSSALSSMLREVAIRVSNDFSTVAKLDFVRAVRLEVGEQGEFRINIETVDGLTVDPGQILSEAYLDLLALLILIEVHIQCAELGQCKIIVLDDVFQSVDSINRIRTLSHIFERLNGWQLVITLHDRLWLSLATSSLNRASIRYQIIEVLNTSHSEPPHLRGGSNSPVDDLKLYVESQESSSTVCGAAGRVLEQICDALSISLESKVVRRRGDRYTLGDLWPGVASSLRKHGTPLQKEYVTAVTQFLDLRNLIGAHFNEWADGLAAVEATDFGRAAIGLYDACRCQECGSYFTKFRGVTGRGEIFGWSCSCARG